MNEILAEKLNAITRKWWFYLLLLLPMFARTCASKGYDARQSIEVIMEALANPLIYNFPVLFPIAKAIPVILIVGVILLGNKMRRAFNVYVAFLFLAIAIFQNSAQTAKFGFVVSTGNLIMVLLIALIWIWEVFTEQNDFTPRKRSLWRWWVIPMAALALLAPVSSSASSSVPLPDFSLARLLASESGLTNCMMTPVILAVLTLYHPTVNLPLLRVMSFVGIYFGIVNMIVWFIVIPPGWWMGVLHIPLLSISFFAFILGIGRKK
jgi:hypothetical protein